MENALPRRAAGTPRTWMLCMTSENHGTVGPAGCTFSHAPDKHERVLVVEVAAANKAAEEGELPALDEFAMEKAATEWAQVHFRHAINFTRADFDIVLAAWKAATGQAIAADYAARPVANKAEAEPSEPTDIAARLRARAAGSIANQDDAKLMATAADECDRFYGGMMAWKKTAQKKDRDWNEERMARQNERCAARAGLPAWIDNLKGSDPTIDGLIEYIIATPPATTGASTVLTDERIGELLQIWRTGNPFLQDSWPTNFARTIEREVAAQAGQVAVPDFGQEVTRLVTEIRKDCSMAWRDSLVEQLIELIDPSPAKESK